MNTEAQDTLKGKEEAPNRQRKMLYLNFSCLVIKYEFYFITAHTKSVFWASDQPRSTPILKKGAQARR